MQQASIAPPAAISQGTIRRWASQGGVVGIERAGLAKTLLGVV
jgi:hypothetical protein